MLRLQKALYLSLIVLIWGCKTTTPPPPEPKSPQPEPKSKSAKIIEYKGLYYQEGTTIPFTGRQVGYWPNGRMMQDVSFREGKKHGTERRWFYNGKAYYEKNYQRGKLHGFHKEWDMQGSLKLDESWDNGQLKEKRK